LERGQSTNCYTVYRIGYIRDDNGELKNFDYYPTPPMTLPLQQTATDILGMDYYELNYGIAFRTSDVSPIGKKYVVISPESTAGCKEWTIDNWSYLSKLIKDMGYEVISLTMKPYKIDGVTNLVGVPLHTCVQYFKHASLFIGLSSGQSWLNWAIGKHTVMISGFTDKFHEFQTNITRIHNQHACNSCWHNPSFNFDPGNWDWCPVWEGTEKQHICQKSISPLMVFNEIKNII